MLVQLNPPLHMETPKGKGWAHFCIDYGPETHLLWVVFMDADGACWTGDKLYVSCPVYFKGPPGYYWAREGHWFWHRSLTWDNRLSPPPHVWLSLPTDDAEEHGGSSFESVPFLSGGPF